MNSKEFKKHPNSKLLSNDSNSLNDFKNKQNPIKMFNENNRSFIKDEEIDLNFDKPEYKEL